MNRLLTLVFLAFQFGAHAQYRIFTPHYPEGIVTNHLDSGHHSIAFKPGGEARKMNLAKKFVIKIECPDGREIYNGKPKMTSSFYLPVNPETALLHYRDTIPVDAQTAQDIRAMAQGWAITHPEFLLLHEKEGVSWSRSYRVFIHANQEERNFRVYYDVRVAYENGNIAVEMNHFKFVHVDELQFVYPGPENNYTHFPERYQKDLSRIYAHVPVSEHIESFWFPLKQSMWELTQAIFRKANTTPPYLRFGIPDPDQTSDFATMVTTNRNVQNIRLFTIDNTLVSYQLTGDSAETLRTIAAKKVYSIEKENGEFRILSRRSPHESANEDSLGAEFLFDQNGVNAGISFGSMSYSWNNRMKNPSLVEREAHTLTTLNTQFGKTWYFSGIPQKYALGAQITGSFGLAFDNKLTIVMPGLKLGLVNSIKTSKNTSIECRLNTGILATLWKYESDLYVEWIVLPQKAQAAILFSPELRFRYRKLAIGALYDKGFFTKSKVDSPRMDQLSLSLSYYF